MIVRIAAMEEELHVDKEQIGVIEFEETVFFRKIVHQLCQIVQGERIENQQIIVIDDDYSRGTLLLFDVFTFPEAVKKHLLKALSDAVENDILTNPRLYESWLVLQRSMFARVIDFVVDYPLEYDFTEKIKVIDFFRCLNLELIFEKIWNPLELIEALCELNERFNLYDRIFIVDCKKYLSEPEIKRLYERIIFLNQQVLLVESSHDHVEYSFERKLKIFSDFTCEIAENMV